MYHEPPTHHPYASVLRQRAATLRDLARSIERSLVMTLEQVAGDQLTGDQVAGDDIRPSSWSSSPKARLCEAMLARNLHQLHQAVDDLRDTAFRMQARAGELELGVRAQGAA